MFLIDLEIGERLRWGSEEYYAEPSFAWFVSQMGICGRRRHSLRTLEQMQAAQPLLQTSLHCTGWLQCCVILVAWFFICLFDYLFLQREAAIQFLQFRPGMNMFIIIFFFFFTGKLIVIKRQKVKTIVMLPPPCISVMRTASPELWISWLYPLGCFFD